MLKRGGKPGYTIVELLMTVALVGLVAAAVTGAYQVAQQNYMRASSLEAAQDGARVGLDRMANELRLIGSFWVGANGAGNSITNATATSITFMASVNDLYMLNAGAAEARANSFPTASSVTLSISTGDTDDAFKVYQSNQALNDYAYIANGGNRDVRQITVKNGSTLTLAAPGLSVAYPVGSLVRDVKTITYALNGTTLFRTQGGDTADPIVDNVTNLTFTYFQSDGVTTTTDPVLIREIQIDLTVQSPNGSARRMTTRVKPRSLL